MKTPHSTVYKYTAKTVAAANKLTLNTISESTHKQGMLAGEPLIIAMDAMLKQAEAYQIHFKSKISEDYVLGPAWLKAVTGIRDLCNGDGANALRSGFTIDSKDNGCVESVFWDAMDMAGFSETDI